MPSTNAWRYDLSGRVIQEYSSQRRVLADNAYNDVPIFASHGLFSNGASPSATNITKLDHPGQCHS